MKKFLSLFLVFQLMLNIAYPTYLAADEIIECNDVSEKEFFPVADETGKTVYTKQEVVRECIIEEEVQGACIEWEETNEEFAIEEENYNAYRSENHAGAMSTILATVSAYDQLEHLWSGWKGYCEIGTKTDFDWLSDPLFWAGLVASAIIDGSSLGDVNSATIASNGAYADAIAAGTTRASAQVAADAAYAASMSATKGFLAETAIGASVQSMQSTLASWASGSVLATWVGATAGKCLMATGFDLGKSLLSSAIVGNGDDDMCDPVDEFCGSTDEQTEDGDIMTIDSNDYADLLLEHPEIADYIIVLGEENGIMTIRFINVNEMANADEFDEAALQEAMEELQKMQLYISVAMTAIKLAGCGVSSALGFGSDPSIDTSYNDGSGLFSVKTGLGMAISAIPTSWLGPLAPYAALIKGALQIMLNFLYSFQDIDSCHSEEDAAEQGSRHEKTEAALPYDLCYFKYKKCVDNCSNSYLGLADPLIGHFYCCYDQILTKVLVIQLKAQLGRDWAHCTGITLRDLDYVDLRQCSSAEMENGIDGGLENQPGAEEGEYDPTETFQYKNRCVDLTEFMEYLEAQIGDGIDMSDFSSMFEDVETQGTQSNLTN